MKATRVSVHGGPEVLRLEELEAPAPGPGESPDPRRRRGRELHRGLPAHGPVSEGPAVDAVGPGVTGAKPGDRVVSVDVRGSHAELAIVAADRLVPVPEEVDLHVAAAVLLQGMTAHYLTHSTHALEPGEACLVHAAAGGVGLLLCQVARRRGARVFGTTSNDAKAALAREAGADEVIDYTRADVAAEVRRLTGGRGVRVVYDSVGRTTFEGSLDSLCPRGMLVLFGQSSGPVGPFDLQVLNRKGSLFLTRPTLAHYTATTRELRARADEVLGWVRDGSLRVRIERTFPLATAAEAHAALESRLTSGKLLLAPDGGPR